MGRSHLINTTFQTLLIIIIYQLTNSLHGIITVN